MKIKNLIIILFIFVILSGLMMGMFVLVDEREAVPGRIDQKQPQTAERHAAASISKGTILLLLAVGIIGALGVSRKKNGNGNHLNRTADDGELQSPGADEERQKLITRNF